MNNLTEIKNLQFFFDNNPRTKFNDVMDIADAVVCYKRLGGKNLSSITKAMQSDYKQAAKIESEFGIANYKTYKLPVLRQMVVEHYQSVFAEIESSECKIAVTAETFIKAPLTIGRPVEILECDEHDFDELINNSRIEFNEDKNGHSTIPKLSLVEDFFETVVPSTEV